MYISHYKFLFSHHRLEMLLIYPLSPTYYHRHLPRWSTQTSEWLDSNLILSGDFCGNCGYCISANLFAEVHLAKSRFAIVFVFLRIFHVDCKALEKSSASNLKCIVCLLAIFCCCCLLFEAAKYIICFQIVFCYCICYSAAFSYLINQIKSIVWAFDLYIENDTKS